MAENETGEPRNPNRAERNAATSQRDNGGGDPSEAPANNGRPNDIEIREHQWAVENSTLAGRAKQAAKRKQVSKDADAVEDKQVASASTKRTAKKS